MSRSFEAKAAVREHVPVMVGLMGPSGSGKTFSALRLATGISEVVGGEIYVIDTEARRSLHYSDMFRFKHIQFDPPFGSLDYLDALSYAVRDGAKTVIVDSMSHEHEGTGGLLDSHERELDKLGGNDWGKRERVKMMAWQKPKAARRQLINAMLQMNANFICCFRAKQTVKPVRVGNKTEIVPQGFLPIAGPEFLFEMTVNILLLPKSGGVPTWRSDNAGETLMMKLPKQFEGVFADAVPLDEQIGKNLAVWAAGGVEPQRPAAEASTEDAMEWDRRLGEAAKGGVGQLQTVWASVPKELKQVLKVALDRRHKPAALEVDSLEPPPPADTESDPVVASP